MQGLWSAARRQLHAGAAHVAVPEADHCAASGQGRKCLADGATDNGARHDLREERVEAMSNVPFKAIGGSGPERSRKEFEQKMARFRVATGRAERFIQSCACVAHDRPFTVTYERTDPAKPFTIVSIDLPSANGGRATDAGRQRTLPAGEIDSTGWECPYCHTSGFVLCDKCNTAVCAARVQQTFGPEGPREAFRCRDSCGRRSDYLVPVREVFGTDPRTEPKALPPAPGMRALPLSSAPL